jgi:AAA15 family ATPase/GTPase
MIIDFSVKNFGPIREEQILSFEATIDDTLKDYYIVEPIPGLRLLKLLVIYGPNASGKSTVLNALEFLRDLCLDPTDQKNNELYFEPFLFDNTSQNQTSVLKLSFLINELRYQYEVEFTKKYIYREKLQYYPKGRIADFYIRETDVENQVSKITFGSTVKIGTKEQAIIEGNTIWNNTVLGAFTKTNVKIPEFNDILEWFNETFMPAITPSTNLFSWTSDRVEEDPKFKESVIEIIKRADIQINDIDINTKEEDVDDEFISRISLLLPSSKKIDELKKKRKIETKDILFNHTIKEQGKEHSFLLDNKHESRGTLRYYGLSGALSMLINKTQVCTIDEIETSLHPDLMKHFLLIYLANSSKSQLAVTTHNLFLLEEKEILRNDAIWFTQKNDNGTSELYSLADFDTSTIRKGASIINSYKTGKLGAKPELGNVFLSSENGKA